MNWPFRRTSGESSGRRRVPAAVVVVAVACGIVGVKLVARTIAGSPELVVEEGGRLRYAGAAGSALRSRAGYPETRAERFSIRVAEAELLALGLSLVATSTVLKHHRPAPDAAALASGLTLLPAGIEAVEGTSGAYRSQTSDLAVRYRPDPIGIEIYSVARDPESDGEPLVARIDGEAWEIYVAPGPETREPRPLCNSAELKSDGWMPMDRPVETGIRAEWRERVGRSLADIRRGEKP